MRMSRLTMPSFSGVRGMRCPQHCLEIRRPLAERGSGISLAGPGVERFHYCQSTSYFFFRAGGAAYAYSMSLRDRISSHPVMRKGVRCQVGNCILCTCRQWVPHDQSWVPGKGSVALSIVTFSPGRHHSDSQVWWCHRELGSHGRDVGHHPRFRSVLL